MITFLCVIFTDSSSKYHGVSLHTTGVYKKNKKWRAIIYVNKKAENGGRYENELDAAKKVNQMCDEFKIERKNPDVTGILKYRPKKEKTSQYRGVYWHKQSGKWYAYLNLQNKGKQKYGGSFNNELDAAKRVNQLCEEMEIFPQNPGISEILTQQYTAREKTSQYKSVYWNHQNAIWHVKLSLGGRKQKHGGCFKREVDAAKRVNQLCEEMKIPLQNPGIEGIPNQQSQRKSSSKYKGVCLDKKSGKWRVLIYFKGKQKNGGYFNNELDAAKKAKKVYEQMKILAQNSEITEMPNQSSQRTQSTSKQEVVSWNKKRKLWQTEFYFDGQKRKSYLQNKFNAGDKIEIHSKNLEIVNHHKYDETAFDYKGIKTECEDLIKYFCTSDDPDERKIKQYLITINCVKKKIINRINFNTKVGELILSIAAKNGFFNLVKFLISKGVNKEHFTKDFHTPLSLAVSGNDFKTVEILLNDWISPNTYADGYIHLAPIFNVKSRKIAQLLVDNDAVTNGIYNQNFQSPLTVACQNGFLDVVEFFLDDNLDINHLDRDNKTPLDYAFFYKYENLSTFLIKKGARTANEILIVNNSGDKRKRTKIQKN